MAAQKRQTLEQKRAVVLEPHERKAVSLVQQLNALRNEKAVKKREKQARQRQVSLNRLCYWHKDPSPYSGAGLEHEVSRETHGENPKLFT